MNRPHVRSFAVGAVVITAAFALACSDRTNAPPPLTAPATNGTSRATSYDKAAERGKAHRNNPSDWVGLAHNRALDDYRAKLRQGQVSRDVCNDLVEFAADQARAPKDDQRSRAERIRAGRDALRRMGLCADRFAVASAASSAKLAQDVTISAAMEAILYAICDAIVNAVDSYDLAYRLNQLYPSIAVLPAREAEVTYATASVAVSSSEYWEANTEAAYRDINAAYGGCIPRYTTSVDDAAKACMGLSGGGSGGGGSELMLYRHGAERPSSSFSLAQLPRDDPRTVACFGYLDLRKTVGSDFLGAFGGGSSPTLSRIFSTLLGRTVVAGAAVASLPGVIGAAVSASIGAFFWETAQVIWCANVGGALPASART